MSTYLSFKKERKKWTNLLYPVIKQIIKLQINLNQKPSTSADVDDEMSEMEEERGASSYGWKQLANWVGGKS